jgi:hypothetical protein
MINFTGVLKHIYNEILLFAIPYCIMTTDAKGEEGGIDLVMNFAALYIMCDIDNLMAYKDDRITMMKESIEKIKLEDLMTIYDKNTKETYSSKILDCLTDIASVWILLMYILGFFGVPTYCFIYNIK